MDNIKKGYKFSNVSKDFYGVIPHERAIEIADYEFFWDSVDELAPFGSEEGYIAFIEFNDWMIDNPNQPAINCIIWVLNSWDLSINDYNDKIIEDENILKIIKDLDFDEDLLALDVAIIATGFSQLIIEGKIDNDVKNIVHLAILRQMNSNVLNAFLDSNEDWKYERYKYLQILLEILEKA
ncbi:hypothetical protein LJB96_03210 [Methanobrevibacter sp. OttesenSCG-928-K11]|nr:hypothetical protein [Methanobrevibacter sp. OttesenSCG-928-K11]MDL2270778.1 hypothetical protein [Methanobrevibacter sp. OttesenSCG-928-I08]